MKHKTDGGAMKEQQKYQKFHRLKKEIIDKLQSIQEGDRMDSPSDNIVEDMTNSETFKECLRKMDELKMIADELLKIEE